MYGDEVNAKKWSALLLETTLVMQGSDSEEYGEAKEMVDGSPRKHAFFGVRGRKVVGGP